MFLSNWCLYKETGVGCSEGEREKFEAQISFNVLINT